MVPMRNRQWFWESCGEDCLKVAGRTSERVDPLLKLFCGCEIMLTKNECVKSAIANGTRATLKSVHLKNGERPFHVIIRGVKVPAVFASSVRHAVFKHKNKHARPQEFRMEPRMFQASARVPKSRNGMSSVKPKDRQTMQVQLNQLPVVSNSATTVHKLQGSGVDKLTVSEWRNEASWICVVLSRITTREGLYLRAPLKPNLALHKMPEMLKQKLSHFRKHCVRRGLTEQEYSNICKPCHVPMYAFGDDAGELSLPVLQHVFSHLMPTDISAAMQTCKQTHTCISFCELNQHQVFGHDNPKMEPHVAMKIFRCLMPHEVPAASLVSRTWKSFFDMIRFHN